MVFCFAVIVRILIVSFSSYRDHSTYICKASRERSCPAEPMKIILVFIVRCRVRRFRPTRPRSKDWLGVNNLLPHSTPPALHCHPRLQPVSLLALEMISNFLCKRWVPLGSDAANVQGQIGPSSSARVVLVAIPADAARFPSHHNSPGGKEATLKTTRTRASTAKASTRKASDVPRSSCYWLRPLSRWLKTTSLESAETHRRRAGIIPRASLCAIGEINLPSDAETANPAQSRSSFSTVPV